jgi:hypothetical protein
VQSVAAALVIFVSYVFAPGGPPSATAPHAAVNINYVYGLDDSHPQAWMAPRLWVLSVLAVNVVAFCLPAHLVLRRWFPRASGRLS